MAEQYKTYTQIPLGSSRLDTFDVSSLSCLVCRAVLFVKFGAAKMHGLDTSNVSSHVVSKRDELSGIWPILLSLSVFAALPAIEHRRSLLFTRTVLLAARGRNKSAASLVAMATAGARADVMTLGLGALLGIKVGRGSSALRVMCPLMIASLIRTSFARRSFSTSAPLTWNSLPPAV